MRKLIATCGLVLSCFLGAPAYANVIQSLTLNFASGAIWSGTVTFDYLGGALVDADGTLTGGPNSGQYFGWTWWEGTNQTNPNDYDSGTPGTYEDILMGGLSPMSYDMFIGISWFHGNAGDVPVLNLVVADNYWRSASNGDLIVSGAFSSVPEPASIALIGLGLLGLGFSRWKKEKQTA